jgi:hypothetical protein
MSWLLPTGAPSGGPFLHFIRANKHRLRETQLKPTLGAAALQDLLRLVVLCLPDPCDVASYRAITWSTRFLAVHTRVGVVGQKVELVAESLNDGAGEILRFWHGKVVERFVDDCKGPILVRERRKMNRHGCCGARRRWVNTNDGVPRCHFLVRYLNGAVANENSPGKPSAAVERTGLAPSGS